MDTAITPSVWETENYFVVVTLPEGGDWSYLIPGDLAAAVAARDNFYPTGTIMRQRTKMTIEELTV